MKNEKESQVGIFWTWNREIFHIESSPLSKGIHTSISIDYPAGHYVIWLKMKKQGLLNKLPLTLQDEYDSIPRGRVVYLFAKESFVIYHGDEFSEKERQELIELLNLPKDRTVDEVEEHYNVLPDDFLF